MTHPHIVFSDFPGGVPRGPTLHPGATHGDALPELGQSGPFGGLGSGEGLVDQTMGFFVETWDLNEFANCTGEPLGFQGNF